MRRVLDDDEYLEVETPILNSQAGGALARPFITKANELDFEFELRVSPIALEEVKLCINILVQRESSERERREKKEKKKKAKAKSGIRPE